MKMKIIKIALFALVLIPEMNAIAQKITVTGSVTAFNFYPINNAVVKSLKTGETVLTDSLGRFSVSCLGNDFLQVFASGFIEKKIRIRKPEKILIDLQYGYKETSFSDAVDHNHLSSYMLKQALKKYPDKPDKDYSRYRNIFELIQSEINGIRVSGSNIYSVKTTSFSLSQQVLYVVNDIIVNDISYISPFEVKKVEYLEGPDASTYGMRGANGVIRITLRYN
jgi:hypothetical protein